MKRKIQKNIDKVYSRNDFKNEAEEIIGHAMIRFYEAQLFTKNGHFEFVYHLMLEVRTLIDTSLFILIHRDIHGFKDKRQALDEVIASLKLREMSYRKHGLKFLRRVDFKLAKSRKRINKNDMKAFWLAVSRSIDASLY